MKCLWHYTWVKLPREILPEGKGIMGDWARLASRAAFRKGTSFYCGYHNQVIPGMWAGGVVGLKSILGKKSRNASMAVLERLAGLGYVSYELDKESKKLTYQIRDWVMACSGAACMKGAVYTTEGYGFLCMPRNLTERLAGSGYHFEEADAWLDLWCHTVSEDTNNAFSFMAPAVQYGKYGALLTLETLGQRWGWEKTKVWRFMKKHGDVFALYRLPGSYGCLIFNKKYPVDTEVSLPGQEDVLEVLEQIRAMAADVPKKGTMSQHMGRMVAWYSRKLAGPRETAGEREAGEEEGRVAFSAPIINAYLSLCRNCKNYRYDCRKVDYYNSPLGDAGQIRGPCVPVLDLTQIGKERIYHG